MILSYADRTTEQFYITGKSAKIPPSVHKVALRKLDYLDAAMCLNDFKVPPGNRLELLSGTLAGLYSIRINDQWRIVFKFENTNAYEVQILDYH